MRADQRGQALIEMAVFFIAVIPILGAFIEFTRWFQIQEKLLMASWYGAQMYSSGTVSPAESREKVQQFLITGTPALDPGRITIRMSRASGGDAIWFELDQVSITYQPRCRQKMEETCFIKHAPHYWDPFTARLNLVGIPNITGPAYPW